MVEDEATKWYCDHPSCKRQRTSIKQGRHGDASLPDSAEFQACEFAKHFCRCQKRLQSPAHHQGLTQSSGNWGHTSSSWRQPGQLGRWAICVCFSPQILNNGFCANLFWPYALLKANILLRMSDGSNCLSLSTWLQLCLLALHSLANLS